MHYKNGREANNGDKVVLVPEHGAPVAGILYDAVAGNDYCNGRIAITSSSDPCPNLKECLRADDVLALAAVAAKDPSEAPALKAERMFNAYNAQGPNPGKTWDGKDVPAWSGLNDQVRGKWIAAASALAIAFLLLPLPAFAQTVDVSTAPPSPVVTFLLSLVAPALGLLSLLLIKVLFPALTRFLEALASKSRLAAVALKVEHFAETVVADLDATMRPELAKALEDGRLDEIEKVKLRALALERMKQLLGTAGLAEVTGVLGLGAAAVEQYLSGVLEKKVDQKNNAAALPRSA